MSADVWLEVDTGAPEGQRIDGTERNLTYNLSGMIRRAGFIGWQNLMGMVAAEAEPMLRKTVENLRSDPAEYRPLNPSNGWGTYEDAIEVLEAMAGDCARHPKAVYGGWL
ncbi:hypothetical protein KIH74_22535 [Kineosporia sp. J2-2]|uniref:Uncharacterized protein n=1 Tax=Kineosporia corallincola TaxID=2835133 RepID=A0ABS5TKV3_9ACTN|nr:hypothetical protein [Kineosporia corallincola]MBT0771735.1 hypothetical protein [Kineosporia corallincola]